MVTIERSPKRKLSISNGKKAKTVPDRINEYCSWGLDNDQDYGSCEQELEEKYENERPSLEDLGLETRPDPIEVGRGLGYERPQHILTRNRVKKYLKNLPPDNPVNIQAIAEETELDWHTVSRALGEIGNVDGRIAEKSTDGWKVIMREGTSCETLAKAGSKAKKEGLQDLASEIKALRSKYCGFKKGGDSSN